MPFETCVEPADGPAGLYYNKYVHVLSSTDKRWPNHTRRFFNLFPSYWDTEESIERRELIDLKNEREERETTPSFGAENENVPPSIEGTRL